MNHFLKEDRKLKQVQSFNQRSALESENKNKKEEEVELTLNKFSS